MSNLGSINVIVVYNKSVIGWDWLFEEIKFYVNEVKVVCWFVLFWDDNE